jgi:hypothetical protein
MTSQPPPQNLLAQVIDLARQQRGPSPCKHSLPTFFLGCQKLQNSIAKKTHNTTNMDKPTQPEWKINK